MDIEDIYDEYETRLRRYAMSLARDPDRADDLVQETLIRAMGHIMLLQQLNRHQRRAWLFRVLKNLVIDEHRANQRRNALFEQLLVETKVVGESMGTLMSTDMLDQVPERDRDLIEMRYLFGMNSQEIAAELKIPAATVRSRLHLAIKRLRARKEEFI